MRRVIFCLLILALSTLVMAETSQVATDFYIGNVDEGLDYVPSSSFWGSYGSYVSWIVVVLIIVIIILNRKKVLGNKAVKRKGAKGNRKSRK